MPVSGSCLNRIPSTACASDFRGGKARAELSACSPDRRDSGFVSQPPSRAAVLESDQGEGYCGGNARKRPGEIVPGLLVLLLLKSTACRTGHALRWRVTNGRHQVPVVFGAKCHPGMAVCCRIRRDQDAVCGTQIIFRPKITVAYCAAHINRCHMVAPFEIRDPRCPVPSVKVPVRERSMHEKAGEKFPEACLSSSVFRGQPGGACPKIPGASPPLRRWWNALRTPRRVVFGTLPSTEAAAIPCCWETSAIWIEAATLGAKIIAFVFGACVW